jgi:hypothetical protein
LGLGLLYHIFQNALCFPPPFIRIWNPEILRSADILDVRNRMYSIGKSYLQVVNPILTKKVQRTILW